MRRRLALGGKRLGPYALMRLSRLSSSKTAEESLFEAPQTSSVSAFSGFPILGSGKGLPTVQQFGF